MTIVGKLRLAWVFMTAVESRLRPHR